jgi:acyl-CoA synthetase (AMP-forming)/AMP-acid ligase II
LDARLSAAAGIGEPDGPRKEATVALAIPTAPPFLEERRALCPGRLAEFKVPHRFLLTADLPRGPTGKFLKRLPKEWPGHHSPRGWVALRPPVGRPATHPRPVPAQMFGNQGSASLRPRLAIHLR